jgi:hypothetical protein
MLDARKTFVVGVALFFGLSVEMVPGLYADLPLVLKPMVETSLALTTLLAVVLNLLFRIGIAKRAELELRKGDDPERIFAFMERNGGAWGARPDVIRQAAIAINECYEIISGPGSQTVRSTWWRGSTSSASTSNSPGTASRCCSARRPRRRPRWCAIPPARCASPPS